VTFLLSELLENVSDVSGVDAIAVTNVTAKSREISEGDVFFALPGVTTHGDAFAVDAVTRGAVAMITDRVPAMHPGVPFIVVEDVSAVYARVAAKVSGPQPEFCVAVTGTSGKTSVASFVRQLWQANGLSAATIGTLGVDVNGVITAGELTTPDPLTLHKSLAALKADGVDHVALEASSHGLDQRRLDGLQFKVVGFTNLGRDHLDYHADEEAYRTAKLRLFKNLLAEDGKAVVNSDDPEHMPFMFAALDRGATLLTVGTEGAYFEISSVERRGWGHFVTGRLVGEPVAFLLPLAGRFQVDNAVMAASIAIQSGADPEVTVEALNSLHAPKGRMELVAQPNNNAIFVDYSHKPDALAAALNTLREHAGGKVVVVFGCGGDRDQGKRPLMGEVAARYADKVIVTDDNPRTENPQKIRAAIVAGAPGAIEIADRAEAIQTAISDLGDGDVLLIAGKGHEDYQIVGAKKLPFSDHEIVAQAIKT